MVHFSKQAQDVVHSGVGKPHMKIYTFGVTWLSYCMTLHWNQPFFLMCLSQFSTRTLSLGPFQDLKTVSLHSDELTVY